MNHPDTIISQLVSLGLSEADARAAAEALGDDAPSYLTSASPPAPMGYTPLADDLPAYEATDAERARRAGLGRAEFLAREQALRELYKRYHAERRASASSVTKGDEEREAPPPGIRGMGRRMSDAVKNAESSWTKRSAKYYMPMLSRWGTR
ncbi:hypothetical protein Q8F55_006066 [Vanrija albida]|uniref:UBA domain-containing protein n=1 Tax=Vanrija albida TaxID=181172 RepID=A0ABR3Q4D9_9TREE